jgi:hypothetical protein
VPHEDRQHADLRDRSIDVAHEVVEPAPVQPTLASAVPAQADGVGGEAVLRKEWQEMLIPYPGAQVGAVYEQQRHRVGHARRVTADDLEFHVLTTDGKGLGIHKTTAAYRKSVRSFFLETQSITPQYRPTNL